MSLVDLLNHAVTKDYGLKSLPTRQIRKIYVHPKTKIEMCIAKNCVRQISK